jgi:hypothetical protein
MRFSKGIRDFTKNTPSELECTRISSPFSRDLPLIPRQNGNVGGFRALLSADCLWTPHTIGMFLISSEQSSDCLWAPHTIGMSLIFNGATRGLSTDTPHNRLVADFQRSNARIVYGFRIKSAYSSSLMAFTF